MNKLVFYFVFLFILINCSYAFDYLISNNEIPYIKMENITLESYNNSVVNLTINGKYLYLDNDVLFFNNTSTKNLNVYINITEFSVNTTSNLTINVFVNNTLNKTQIINFSFNFYTILPTYQRTGQNEYYYLINKSQLPFNVQHTFNVEAPASTTVNIFCDIDGFLSCPTLAYYPIQEWGNITINISIPYGISGFFVDYLVFLTLNKTERVNFIFNITEDIIEYPEITAEDIENCIRTFNMSWVECTNFLINQTAVIYINQTINITKENIIYHDVIEYNTTRFLVMESKVDNMNGQIDIIKIVVDNMSGVLSSEMNEKDSFINSLTNQRLNERQTYDMRIKGTKNEILKVVYIVGGSILILISINFIYQYFSRANRSLLNDLFCVIRWGR